jgi:anti-sigma-K factor RskA
MMTHEEAQELLAAYALDAVDGVERSELDLHVLECVRCSSELDALRHVAATMGNVGEPASEAIWQRISAHLYDEVGRDAPPPIRALEHPAAVVSPLINRRRSASLRTKYVAGAFSVAAAALVGVLAVNLVQADNHVSQLNNALALAGHHAVLSALETPGHVEVTLTGKDKADVVQFVLLNGHGLLVSSSMARLSSAQTYQLWGIINGKPISIGLMGTLPSNVAFSVQGALRPSELAITVEPAGGSVTPTSPIVASGSVTA